MTSRDVKIHILSVLGTQTKPVDVARFREVCATSQRHLTEVVGLGGKALGQIFQGLANKGLVVITPRDKERHVYSLSREGAKIALTATRKGRKKGKRTLSSKKRREMLAGLI